MDILVYSWRDPRHPYAGGAEQVMHEHMKGWVESGHEVTLFSSKFPGSKSEEKIDNVNVIRRGYQYCGVQLMGFLFYLANRNNYDFVVDQFHGIPFFTPLYSKKPKLAVLQEVAREVWLKNPLPRPLNWIIGFIGYHGEFFVYQIYRLFRVPFMVGSDSAKSELAKMGIDKNMITIVPHGTKIVKQKPNHKKEKIKTICFLGALSRDKGIEDALKAFAILNESAKYNFWVIGRPESKEYFNELKTFAHKHKINVKFWGFVSDKKKFELLARSHIMLNPSILEGWGLVNIEANAMGVPVVAYQSPGLVDSVCHNVSGLLCRENSPSCLANTVQELLSNKNRYKKLQSGALNWSKGFSWEKSKKLGLELVESVA